MKRLDERNPFVQLVFWSLLVGVIGFFISGVLLEIFSPEMRTPLTVPFFIAFYMGTLAFLAEAAKRHYGLAVIGFLIALVLFPGSAWLLIKLLKLRGEAATFAPLLPAFIALGFFSLVHRRFEKSGGPS